MEGKKTAVLSSPLDSEKFIIDYKKRVEELSVLYPEVTPWVIKEAAFYHTKDPRGFIEDYKKGKVRKTRLDLQN